MGELRDLAAQDPKRLAAYLADPHVKFFKWNNFRDRKNKRGTLAMARTADPHSATGQFFINHRDNAFLDYPGQDGWGYAVFGKLVSGEDVLDKIAAVKTGSGDVPGKPVVIKSIRRVEPEK